MLWQLFNVQAYHQHHHRDRLLLQHLIKVLTKIIQAVENHLLNRKANPSGFIRCFSVMQHASRKSFVLWHPNLHLFKPTGDKYQETHLLRFHLFLMQSLYLSSPRIHTSQAKWTGQKVLNQKVCTVLYTSTDQVNTF